MSSNSQLPLTPEPEIFVENFRTANYIPRCLQKLEEKGFIKKAFFKVLVFFFY